MSNMFSGMGMIIDGMFIALAICIPLAIWKLVDIIIWIIHHVKVGIQ
jgi:hypothetical protein